MSKIPVWQQIAEHLLRLIRKGALRPGQQLPPERALADSLEVSRTSVREALRALAILNVLEVRQGAGTYVTSLEPELLVQHMNLAFQFSGASYLELFAARKVLEVGIAGLAAQTINDAEIERLESAVAAFAEHLDDPEMLLEIDLDLHDTIAQATRNPILIRMMAGVRELGRASRRRTVRIPGTAEKTVDDHRMIVHALTARDSKSAQAAMLVHLSRVEMLLEQAGEKQETDSAPEMDGAPAGATQANDSTEAATAISAAWKR